MPLGISGEIEKLRGRWGGESGLTDGQQDISSSVETEVGNVPVFSVYLSTAGAVTIDVKLSPDGGSTWYTPPESPIEFSAADDDIVNIEYNATDIRLTGRSTTAVQAQIREVV